MDTEEAGAGTGKRGSNPHYWCKVKSKMVFCETGGFFGADIETPQPNSRVFRKYNYSCGILDRRTASKLAAIVRLFSQASLPIACLALCLTQPLMAI